MASLVKISQLVFNQEQKSKFASHFEGFQGRSESTSSVVFEVLIVNCQIYFLNFLIFNYLTLNINMFIFKLFDIKFLFSENHVFANRRERLFMGLWTRVLSFGF